MVTSEAGSTGMTSGTKPEPFAPQTRVLLCNFILHSYRFGMQEELRYRTPLLGLTLRTVKHYAERIASVFGYVQRWKHCQSLLRSVVTVNQFAGILVQLSWLEFKWRNSPWPIGDSRYEDPDLRLAYKISLQRGLVQSHLDDYLEGRVKIGGFVDAGPSFIGWPVTELSSFVWSTFLMVLERLEELRLATPGAQIWPEKL
jgi:hypothetical protein